MNVKSYLGDKGTHIFLYGCSKNGKSSLWKKYIGTSDFLEIKITKDIDVISLFNIIIEKLKVYIHIEMTRTNVLTNEVNGEVAGEIQGYIKSPC